MVHGLLVYCADDMGDSRVDSVDSCLFARGDHHLGNILILLGSNVLLGSIGAGFHWCWCLAFSLPDVWLMFCWGDVFPPTAVFQVAPNGTRP